jgi:hypothetical protein
VARVGGAREEVEAELRRLSRWVAVAIAVIDCSDPLDESIEFAAPNVLLGRPFNDSDTTIPGWAKLVFAEVTSPQGFARRIAGMEQPVIAMRRSEGPTDLVEARMACDQLQRDLAPFGDFAGYMIVAGS